MEPQIGIKSYPITVAKAMEEVVRNLAGLSSEEAVDVGLEYTRSRAEDIVEVLNKWR